jgi:NADPH2 dehydrogenase
MLYQSLEVKNLKLKNRSVMAPMCMYQSDHTGVVKDFHVIHYATRAIGGVGLIIQEATAIDPDGRISVNDLGIWDDAHVKGLKKIVDQIHENGAVAGIQINHAGRKARVENPIAPSANKFSDELKPPKAMTLEDIKKVIDQFKQAARRADEAGYDLLELHAAHGYLLFQFLSPNTNLRTDAYKDPKKLITEVVMAVREVWPKEKALAIRFSAYEYAKKSVTPEWIAELLNEIKHFGIDIIDVSSGGNVVEQEIKIFPGYQLDFAKTIKMKTDLITMGGGLIDHVKLADYAISDGLCDLIYFGRVLLREPYFMLNHASELGIDIEYPKPYSRGKK